MIRQPDERPTLVVEPNGFLDPDVLPALTATLYVRLVEQPEHSAFPEAVGCHKGDSGLASLIVGNELRYDILAESSASVVDVAWRCLRLRSSVAVGEIRELWEFRVTSHQLHWTGYVAVTTSQTSAGQPDFTDWSCQGTLVTITPGSNSSRAFSRSALWLCSSCSHQRPTTYSGMNTVTTSRGLLRCKPRM